MDRTDWHPYRQFLRKNARLLRQTRPAEIPRGVPDKAENRTRQKADRPAISSFLPLRVSGSALAAVPTWLAIWLGPLPTLQGFWTSLDFAPRGQQLMSIKPAADQCHHLRRMVGATGIEPVTPSMSTRCSPAELRAPHGVVVTGGVRISAPKRAGKDAGQGL